MKYIENRTFDEERALYHTKDAVVRNCRFAGPADGESFLKESENITAENCYMDLRYPLWHVSGLTVTDSEMTERCRAAIWYSKNVHLARCRMHGIKALRECDSVELCGNEIVSPEFGWRCKRVRVEGGRIESEYAFFETEDLTAEGIEFHGKYAFQYTKNVEIANSRFCTKDAFWHSENATVKDSVIDGEYLGWYSNGLTLINCHIRGTQPLCYCKDLTLVDCTTEDADLAFEYSDVRAEIKGEILSVKNPLRGRIVADRIGEVVTSGCKYPSSAEVITRR